MKKPFAAQASLSDSLDWGELSPLRLKAKTIAEGVYAGTHRSARRGAGVEFGGHRNYVPGDDLRWLDRRALMRHGRLLVREFETETDRALRLVVDRTPSMAFVGEGAPGAKLAFAAVIAAALARIAIRAGDPVALDWIGSGGQPALSAMGGKEAFARIITALEALRPSGDATLSLETVERGLAPVARRAGRGSSIVVFSDLVDLPEGTLERVASLSTHGRTVVVVRVLSPMEDTFPLEGPVRLRSSEGALIRETDAHAAREGYLRALEAVASTWSEQLISRRGRLLRAVTTDDPVSVVRAILSAIEGRPG